MTRYRVPQLAHKYMDHDMIARYTDLPAFPDGRIQLLFATLSQQPQGEEHKELLAVATSLVQMGLDTHDLVDNASGEGGESNLVMRAKQLKVLAGDFFSSRFYHLLSQAGQIDAVRR